MIWSTIVNAADDSPDDILARMSAAYAAAQSYSDTGEVLVHWKDQSEPNEIRLETDFARPNYFKFVWVAHHPYLPLRHIKWRSAIWSDGTKSYLWLMYDEPASEPQSTPTLELAVAGATGARCDRASGFGISHGGEPDGGFSGSRLSDEPEHFPAPEIQAHSIRELKRLHLLGIEQVEGIPCYHITGSGVLGDHDIWVSTDDLLIRKLRFLILNTPHEEIRRNVKVGVSLPPGTFSFSK